MYVLSRSAFVIVKVCHVDEILKVMGDEERARTRDDRPPDLGGISLAKVGLALKSHLLAPRSEPAPSVETSFCGTAASSGGGISKDILPFPLSFCPTAAEISLSLEAGRAQLGQAEGAEASLDEYIQEAGLEAWTLLVTWALNFVYSGRRGERAGRPETSWKSEMDTKQFEQQSSQVHCLSANIHFTQKEKKYMQNGQLLQLKGDLQKQLSYLTSLHFDQELQQVKLKALILDLIHKIAVMDDLLNHKVQRTSEWHWFRQLRHYLKTNCAPDQKPAFVRMLECEQSYSFEYQGNASKLVQTPLTDKCYLTLMHGMHLGYGGTRVPTLLLAQ